MFYCDGISGSGNACAALLSDNEKASSVIQDAVEESSSGDLITLAGYAANAGDGKLAASLISQTIAKFNRFAQFQELAEQMTAAGNAAAASAMEGEEFLDVATPAGISNRTEIQRENISNRLHVDDTGARHRHQNGYCTVIGNDQFTSFATRFSKNRLNFLQFLIGEHPSYVLNEATFEHMQNCRLPKRTQNLLHNDGQRYFD